VLLEDPLHAIPPYDAIILLSPEASERTGVAAALEPLVGGINVEMMQQANYMVDRDEDKKTVGQAARFLQQEIDTSPENGD
jgi:osmoprotectant transport system permease protein